LKQHLIKLHDAAITFSAWPSGRLSVRWEGRFGLKAPDGVIDESLIDAVPCPVRWMSAPAWSQPWRVTATRR
jgi:hypothetical protein